MKKQYLFVYYPSSAGGRYGLYEVKSTPKIENTYSGIGWPEVEVVKEIIKNYDITYSNIHFVPHYRTASGASLLPFELTPDLMDDTDGKMYISYIDSIDDSDSNEESANDFIMEFEDEDAAKLYYEMRFGL